MSAIAFLGQTGRQKRSELNNSKNSPKFPRERVFDWMNV
jgi:hypothetical protein